MPISWNEIKTPAVAFSKDGKARVARMRKPNPFGMISSMQGKKVKKSS